MKLFSKYALLFLSLLLISAGTITAVSLIHHKKALTREALLRGESIAVNLALVSAEAILTKNILQLVAVSMDATTRHENVAYAAVTDAQGLVLAHPDRAAVGKPFEFKALHEETGYQVLARVLSGQGMGRLLWDVSVPVKSKGSLVELGRVHVGLDKAGVEGSVQKSLNQLLLVAAASLILGLLVSFLAVGYLIRPLRQLSQASAKVGEGDFAVTVPVKGQDELAELSSNFNSMVKNLKLAESRKREAQRLESELKVAHEIQESLLPKEPPKIPGWEMAFLCKPAKELGGDYYDTFEVHGGTKLGFVVADVSGKGVPAALHMANLRNLFRFSTAHTDSPLEVLRQVNALAFPDLKSEAFVTLVYGVLDPASGDLSYVNAGHDPAFWVSSGGATSSLGATAFPVGAVDSDEYDPAATESRLTLGPGDLFFLYTDGVTEAENPQGKQFGLKRIQAALQGSPAKILEVIGTDLEKHLAGNAAQDDITMLALKRN